MADGSTAGNIPDAQVTIRNNTIVNPVGVQSAWQHLEVSTPRRNNDPGVVGPDPARTDDGLVITGNVVRNGAGHAAGVSGDEVRAGESDVHGGAVAARQRLQRGDAGAGS